MKIEIWSDYACLFCYIGEKRLQRALAKVGDKNITIEFKSFELSNHTVLKKIAAECVLDGNEVEDELQAARTVVTSMINLVMRI